MRSIEDVVVTIERWDQERSKDRELVLSQLNAISKNCEEAIEVWQRYLDNPGTGGNQWTAVSWVGPERAKRLHELNLRAAELIHQLCTIAGSEAVRFLAYEDSMIEMAYRQLEQGETGPDMARSAVERMNAHRAYLNSVAERVKSIRLAEAKHAKPVSRPRPGAKKPQASKAKKATVAAAKMPAKKPTRKKAAGSAAKMPAKKKKAAKPARKKSTRKSTKPVRRQNHRRK